MHACISTSPRDGVQPHTYRNSPLCLTSGEIHVHIHAYIAYIYIYIYIYTYTQTHPQTANPGRIQSENSECQQLALVPHIRRSRHIVWGILQHCGWRCDQPWWLWRYVYVCMHVCMYVCMYVCDMGEDAISPDGFEGMSMYAHVCMHAWMYVCVER